MADCEIDDAGKVDCPACGHSYSAEDNCNLVPAPPGSGGCIRSCNCPICEEPCCVERDGLYHKFL